MKQFEKKRRVKMPKGKSTAVLFRKARPGRSAIGQTESAERKMAWLRQLVNGQ